MADHEGRTARARSVIAGLIGIPENGVPATFARSSADKTSAQVPEKKWIDDSG